MTPKEAEELVRARWGVPVPLKDTTTLDRGFGLLLGKRGIWPVTEDWPSVWLAAAEFTLQREEEIRQKREEIEWMSVNGGISPPAVRILAILEAQLAALLVGWKEKP